MLDRLYDELDSLAEKHCIYKVYINCKLYIRCI